MTDLHDGPPTLDPEIAAALVGFPDLIFDETSLPLMRELTPGDREPADDILRSDHVVGDGPVTISIHRPAGAQGPLPCLYWIHGGGLVIGDRHLDVDQLEVWCRELGCACASVEYRLAPEHPFPAAIDDCVEGLEWLIGSASELDLDPMRVGVGGRSAGGGLSAVLAQVQRDRKGSPISFQLLDCPMLDDRQRTPSSRQAGVSVWSRESNAFGWSCYLGSAVGGPDISATAAAARATDLRDLPPAFVIVGGADGLRDEAIEYAMRLGQAGVQTDLHVYAGAPHGIFIFSTTEVAGRAARETVDFLRRAFAWRAA